MPTLALLLYFLSPCYLRLHALCLISASSGILSCCTPVLLWCYPCIYMSTHLSLFQHVLSTCHLPPAIWFSTQCSSQFVMLLVLCYHYTLFQIGVHCTLSHYLPLNPLCPLGLHGLVTAPRHLHAHCKSVYVAHDIHSHCMTAENCIRLHFHCKPM